MALFQMLGKSHRRRRVGLTARARLTCMIAVPAVAVALVGCSVPAVAPAMAAVRPGTSTQQALSQAGRGWALAMYAAGRDTYHSRVTLYLTSAAGAVHAVRTWPHGTQWQLQAWSPDRSRAIFTTEPATGDGPTVVHQFALASGATTTFALPQFSRVIGYTLPTGRSVLVADQSGIHLLTDRSQARPAFLLERGRLQQRRRRDVANWPGDRGLDCVGSRTRQPGWARATHASGPAHQGLLLAGALELGRCRPRRLHTVAAIVGTASLPRAGRRRRARRGNSGRQLHER
jgi:hypothetical protein